MAMMIHMSKEEHELYDELDKTDDPKKIAELRAKLHDIWAKEDDKNILLNRKAQVFYHYGHEMDQ